jgi:hypothetical protein
MVSPVTLRSSSAELVESSRLVRQRAEEARAKSVKIREIAVDAAKSAAEHRIQSDAAKDRQSKR